MGGSFHGYVSHNQRVIMLKMNEHDAGIQMNPVAIYLEMEHWSHLQDVKQQRAANMAFPFQGDSWYPTFTNHTTLAHQVVTIWFYFPQKKGCSKGECQPHRLWPWHLVKRCSFGDDPPLGASVAGSRKPVVLKRTQKTRYMVYGCLWFILLVLSRMREWSIITSNNHPIPPATHPFPTKHQ